MMRPDQILDQRLPFPTRPLDVRGGNAEEYIIPDDHKEVVLKMFYPFSPVPSLDDEMLDLHEDKTFVVRDFRLVREGRMNCLVSPYYSDSGGTVIDWVSDDMAIEYDEDEDKDE